MGRLIVVAFVLSVGACSSHVTKPPAEDPCSVQTTTTSGTVALGLGSQTDPTAFSPMTDGEVVQLQVGAQGFTMVVINVHTDGLDVVDSAGGLTATIEEAGQIVSMFPDCHIETFASDSGFDGLTEPFFLPFNPELEASPHGKMFTIATMVQDVHGDWATASHVITASAM